MEIIRVALTKSSIAALTTSKHRTIGLNYKRAVLTTYDLCQQTVGTVTFDSDLTLYPLLPTSINNQHTTDTSPLHQRLEYIGCITVSLTDTFSF